MVKSPLLPLLTLALLVLDSPTDALDYQSSTETRLESDGEVRARLTAGTEVRGENMTAALLGVLRGGSLSRPVFSLESPRLDLGPMLVTGLLKELSRPCGMASMRQETRIKPTRSLDGASTDGGVIHLEGGGLNSSSLALFALRRGGLAPPGTRSAGLYHRAALWGASVLSTAAEVTVYGGASSPDHEDTPEDWFTPLPQGEIPAVTRFGAGWTRNDDHLSVHAKGGLALSSRTGPAGFLSGYLSYREGIRLDGQRGVPVVALSLSAGAVAPGYLGDDGRYPADVLIVRPLVSVRFPGWGLRGSYGYRLKPLPLLPVVWREQLHDFSATSSLDLWGIEVACGLLGRLRYTEEGRTLVENATTTGFRLPLGALAASGELSLHHSNNSEERVDGLVALELSGRRGRLEVWAKRRGPVLSAGVYAGYSEDRRRIRLSLRFDEISREGMGELSFTIQLGATSG